MTQAREIAELGTLLTVNPSANTVALNSQLISGMLISNGAITSNTATLDIAIPTGFRRYILRLDNTIPATNGSGFNMRISNDSGSTYKSGASDYDWAMLYGGNAGNSSGFGYDSSTGGRTAIVLGPITTGSLASAGFPGSYSIEIYPGTASTHPVISFTSMQTSTTTYGIGQGWGHYNANTVVTNVRFLYGSGNIASCAWSLHGVF